VQGRGYRFKDIHGDIVDVDDAARVIHDRFTRALVGYSPNRGTRGGEYFQSFPSTPPSCQVIPWLGTMLVLQKEAHISD